MEPRTRDILAEHTKNIFPLSFKNCDYSGSRREMAAQFLAAVLEPYVLLALEDEAARINRFNTKASLPTITTANVLSDVLSKWAIEKLLTRGSENFVAESTETGDLT